MTHPIITAYAKYDELAFKSTGVGDRIVQAFDKLDLVSELMASESIPIFR